MKAIVNTGPNRLEMRELPLPEPDTSQVRIRTGACGICATDLEMIAGWNRTGFPSIPGHEWAGTVEAVGKNVDPSLIGKKCVAENVLIGGGEVGFEHSGGYAEYLITEAANIHRLPDDFSLILATLIEPLAVSVRGINRLGTFDVRSPILIFGDGPIGLLVLMLMVKKGIKNITLVGGRLYRLDLARRLGATRTLNYHTNPCNSDEKYFSTIIEASGSGMAMKTALQVVAPGGKVLMLGDYNTVRADFPWNQILHREIELIGSNASAGAWRQAVQLAVEDTLPLGSLITHKLPAHDFLRGMEFMRNRQADAIKVVMKWE